MAPRTLRLLLGGDLMLGRGIDQRMPLHCDPALAEPLIHDARFYMHMTERRHGPITAPMAPGDAWSDAPDWMSTFDAERRIVYLETAITTAERPWPRKPVCFRMHPANVSCLQAAAIDACCLANNHALDWGLDGLAETLHCLRRAGIATAGAGLTPHQAQAAACRPTGRAARPARRGPAQPHRQRHGEVAGAGHHTGAAAGRPVVMSLHWGALRSLAVPPFQLHRFRLRQPAAAVRRLLARQMGLESLADGWRWRDDGELWRLEPQRGTSAAF